MEKRLFVVSLAFSLSFLVGCGSGVGSPPAGDGQLTDAELGRFLDEFFEEEIYGDCEDGFGWTRAEVDDASFSILLDCVSGHQLQDVVASGRDSCNFVCGADRDCFIVCSSCTDKITFAAFGACAVALGH